MTTNDDLKIKVYRLLKINGKPYEQNIASYTPEDAAQKFQKLQAFGPYATDHGLPMYMARLQLKNSFGVWEFLKSEKQPFAKVGRRHF